MAQQIEFQGYHTLNGVFNPEYVKWLEQRIETLQKAILVLQSQQSSEQKSAQYEHDALPYWEREE